MALVPEHGIMEDWIVVQPCPKCGLKRLALGGEVYYTSPLQWVYKCCNGDCGEAGTFGYESIPVRGVQERKIIIHLPTEAEKGAEKELGGIMGLLREHGDMSKLHKDQEDEQAATEA